MYFFGAKGLSNVGVFLINNLKKFDFIKKIKYTLYIKKIKRGIFMLTGNKKFLEKKEEKVEKTENITWFEQGIFALFFKRPMEAAQYFFLLKESKNSAVFFNLALCFFKVKEYQEAYLYLQKALMELPRNIVINSLKNNILSLERYEEESEGYQEAMLYFTPIEFPNLAREQILRLMVDILFYLDQKEEMLRIIASLQSKNYRNIKEKLEKGLR